MKRIKRMFFVKILLATLVLVSCMPSEQESDPFDQSCPSWARELLSEPTTRCTVSTTQVTLHEDTPYTLNPNCAVARLEVVGHVAVREANYIEVTDSHHQVVEIADDFGLTGTYYLTQVEYPQATGIYSRNIIVSDADQGDMKSATISLYCVDVAVATPTPIGEPTAELEIPILLTGTPE